MNEIDLDEVLLKISSALRSEKLVDVETVHVSGISYKNVGDPCIEFLKDLVEHGYRVKVFTTCNPCANDIENLSNTDKQLELIQYLRKLNISTVLTCTPYEFIHIRPRRYYAWAESSAAAFIASVCDAYCEKFPGPLALLCALYGKAPCFGKMRLENRIPRILVVLDLESLLYVEAGILGKFLAETFQDKVILVKTRRRGVFNRECLKSLLASYATYCNNIFLVLEHVNPNFREYEAMSDIEDKMYLTYGDLKRIVKDECITLSEKDLNKHSIFVVGCPHLSFEGAYKCIEILRKIDTKSYVFVPRFVKSMLYSLYNSSYVGNVQIIADTCLFVSYLTDCLKDFDIVYTNSVKQAFYLRKVLRDVEVKVGLFHTLEEAISKSSSNVSR